MKIICAWCKKVIRNDHDADWGLVSHSICEVCYIKEANKMDDELQEVINESERKEKEKKAEADKANLEKSFTLFNSKTVKIVNESSKGEEVL